MFGIGLTGGIGSGKTSVSDRLVARGADLVDADLIVHEVQRPGGPAFG
ncbi:MAG: dephospho-CoA kinase, partial [Acidimicrobiales bacterium]